MSDSQKLRMEIKLELEEAFFPSGDEQAQDWLINRILLNAPAGELQLFSDEVGDLLGTVKVLLVEAL
jgi:hypothetical protein